MASKQAALYFEAYKQHHLVCSSLHTLSRARCPESKVVVVSMGESPRQASPSPSHGTVEDEAAELAACDNIPKNNNMDAVNRPGEPLSCCNYLQVLATPIRLVPGIVDRCKTPCCVAHFLDGGCRNILDPLHAR
jgi:hypothetical protein